MTPEQLERFAKDLTYEVRMLDATARALLATPPSLERNAFLESLLIHARVLDEFLGHDRQHDNVTAGDYAPAWNMKPLPDKLRRVTNKLVAHPSAARLTKEAVNFHAAARGVLAGFQEFVDQLDEPEREWFAEAATVAAGYLRLPTPMNATTTTSTTTVSYLSVRDSLMDYSASPVADDD